MTEATIVRPLERREAASRVEESGIARLWQDALPDRMAHTVVVPFILLMRLTMGWIFLWSGLDKLVTDFSSAGFLTNATTGPLSGWFESLGANQAALDVIDPLVVWGQILIGITLVFGVFTRSGLFWATVMMMMFYLAQFPPANNPFIDEHLVYIIVFGLLGALGAGRILGLDVLIERLPWVRKNRAATLLLG